jgi:hypothetical protein
MLRLLRLFVGLVRRCFCSRRDLLLENLVLRQQLSVFKQRRQRPPLAPFDMGLKKETPGERKTGIRNGECQIVSALRLGGLHHRYDLAA